MERRVLVVEDDTRLEPIFKKMIEQVAADSRVDWTTSVDGALGLIRKEAYEGGSGYDLIISDITLDGPKSGFDLYDYCSKTRLKSKFVLVSGRPIAPSSLPTLRKPVSLTSLRSCIAPILGGRPFSEFASGVRPSLAESVFEALWLVFMVWVMFSILFAAAGMVRFGATVVDDGARSQVTPEAHAETARSPPIVKKLR